jgi:hypothetical protein
MDLDPGHHREHGPNIGQSFVCGEESIDPDVEHREVRPGTRPDVPFVVTADRLARPSGVGAERSRQTDGLGRGP